MNNQLKLPWIQPYRETHIHSRPAFWSSALKSLGQIKRRLGRGSMSRPAVELSRGYAEFSAHRQPFR